MESSQLSHSLPKPWGSLFYYPLSAFRPFPSPLQAIAQSRPSALVLFSLSPIDEGLIVNVLIDSECNKALLRDQLWGGAIIRFTHPYDAAPFTQTPVDAEGVRVVKLEVLTAGEGPIAFEVVPEKKEPLATSFRQFVEKRVWELEMGDKDGAASEDGLPG